MKETIAAGGSYFINNTQATGISFGLDRLEMLSKITPEFKKVLIVSLNEDKKAVQLADKIRSLSIPTQIFFGKPTKALDYANSYNFPLVIFIGDEEVKNRRIKLKKMNTGEEKLIPENKLEEELEKFH